MQEDRQGKSDIIPAPPPGPPILRKTDPIE
jgi:hypothetical protein